MKFTLQGVLTLLLSIFLPNLVFILLRYRFSRTRRIEVAENLYKEISMGEWNIDLHSHTTASDGEFSPAELVGMAKKKGLKALAITDHDTIAGLREGSAAAKKLQVDFIPGVEISCKAWNPKGEAHIVGLFIDYDNEELQDFLESERQKRQDRNVRILDKLNGLFPELKAKVSDIGGDMMKSGESIGRPHIAKLLVEKGYVESVNDAFSKYLKKGAAAFVDKSDPAVSVAVEKIHGAGGIAILAHPQLCKLSAAEFRSYIQYLKGCGIDGIEVLHTSLNGEMKSLSAEMARKYSLLRSGGSDFHGSSKPRSFLGEAYGGEPIPYSFLHIMKLHRENMIGEAI